MGLHLLQPTLPHGPAPWRWLRKARARLARSFTRLLLVFCPASFQASYLAFCAALRARFLALRRFFASDFALLLMAATHCRIEERAERAAGGRTCGYQIVLACGPEPPANGPCSMERVTSLPRVKRHAQAALVFFMTASGPNGRPPGDQSLL